MAQTAVQLQRHPGDTWGFRLQGGKDFAADLSVKKVQPGSPAHQHLFPGDRIVAIGNQPTQGLTHMQANSLIKSCGNVVHFTVIRGPSQDFSAIKPTGPVKFQPWKSQQQLQQMGFQTLRTVRRCTLQVKGALLWICKYSNKRNTTVYIKQNIAQNISKQLLTTTTM